MRLVSAVHEQDQPNRAGDLQEEPVDRRAGRKPEPKGELAAVRRADHLRPVHAVLRHEGGPEDLSGRSHAVLPEQTDADAGAIGQHTSVFVLLFSIVTVHSVQQAEEAERDHQRDRGRDHQLAGQRRDREQAARLLHLLSAGELSKQDQKRDHFHTQTTEMATQVAGRMQRRPDGQPLPLPAGSAGSRQPECQEKAASYLRTEEEWRAHPTNSSCHPTDRGRRRDVPCARR